MARIPKKAQVIIDEVLSRYTPDHAVETFDVLHLYDEKKWGVVKNNGYHQCKHFTLIGFNTQSKLKRDLGFHDGIEFDPLHSPGLKNIQIFADGAMLVKFKEPIHFIHNTQLVYHEWTKS